MNDFKIIYVFGSGRSGTTLVDILLGNQESCFSAGELNRYLKREGIPHDARDEDVSLFWQKIKNDNPIDFAQLKVIADKIEYHSGVFKSSFLKHSDYEKYDQYNQNLFQTISKSIKESHIIDSSKYPLRALRLAKIFKEDISFVYLKRSPISVVESFQKKSIEQPSKSRLEANLYVLLVNILSTYVLKKLRKTNKCAVVEYNLLLSDPIGVFRKIESDLQVPMQNIFDKIRNKKGFMVGYLFDGNRLRLNKEIKIKGNTNQSNNKLINKLFLPLHKFFWYNKKYS